MGVSGSGKTTVGELLSEKTGWPFYDADTFHSKGNIDKMKAGIPLTDEDRWPWLDKMNAFAATQLGSGSIILACSALKEMYRQHLCKGIDKNCCFIFLKGDYDTIINRLQNRQQHYMPATLLRSQFDTLEEPTGAITVDIVQPTETIVEQIITAISKN